MAITTPIRQTAPPIPEVTIGSWLSSTQDMSTAIAGTASGPGLNECAAERMAMNVDAHRTSTVSTAAGTIHDRWRAGPDCGAAPARAEAAAGGTPLVVMGASLAPEPFDGARSVVPES